MTFWNLHIFFLPDMVSQRTVCTGAAIMDVFQNQIDRLLLVSTWTPVSLGRFSVKPTVAGMVATLTSPWSSLVQASGSETLPMLASTDSTRWPPEAHWHWSTVVVCVARRMVQPQLLKSELRTFGKTWSTPCRWQITPCTTRCPKTVSSDGFKLNGHSVGWPVGASSWWFWPVLTANVCPKFEESIHPSHGKEKQQTSKAQVKAQRPDLLVGWDAPGEEASPVLSMAD